MSEKSFLRGEEGNGIDSRILGVPIYVEIPENASINIGSKRLNLEGISSSVS
jgi:hypothetical protein